MDQHDLETAVDWLRHAGGLLISAGAGMGVDSGLPDFRGDQGYWSSASTPAQSGVDYLQLGRSQAFQSDPVRAWTFYARRLAMYREAAPHEGFHILQRWARLLPRGAFVFTSNVDGQFQKAGFDEDRIVECHGSLHRLQCSRPCSGGTWSASILLPDFDPTTGDLLGPLPRCPKCGCLARPNLLMFDDSSWCNGRTDNQVAMLDGWFSTTARPVVIELGAGRVIRTVRHFSERHGPRVLRINPRDFSINPALGVGISGSALEVLKALDQAVGQTIHS